MTFNIITSGDPVSAAPLMQNFRHKMNVDFVDTDANGASQNNTNNVGNPTYQWKGMYAINFYQNGSLLDFSQLISFRNNLISFAVVASTDGYPAYLSAGGPASLTTTLLATTTPFVFNVNGTQTTISVNKTVTITAGFGSNNTMLINEAAWTAASSQETQAKVFGEKAHPSVIMNFDTAGTNISGLSVGDKVVFRAVNSSAAVEYVYCEMVTVGASGTLRILWRAIDSSGVRITFRDNDTWTLCRTNWIFTDGSSLFTTTVHPVEVDTLPSAGTAGKYILLKSTNTWYLDDGASVAITARHLVGASFSHNTTDNGAVAYFPEWGHFSSNFLRLKKSDIQINVCNDNLSLSKGLVFNGTVQFGDKIYKYKDARINTATAGDRTDSTADISAVGIKYVYLSYSTGKLYFSDVMPRQWDDGVLIHPNKMYRCIAFLFHSASLFYPFTYDIGTKTVVLNIATIVPDNSWNTTYANAVMASGYFPSFIKTAKTLYAGSGAVNYYSADSFTSTGDILLTASAAGSAEIGPIYSGYMRRKTGSNVTDAETLTNYFL